jgi:hypothetical protein
VKIFPVPEDSLMERYCESGLKHQEHEGTQRDVFDFRANREHL